MRSCLVPTLRNLLRPLTPTDHPELDGSPFLDREWYHYVPISHWCTYSGLSPLDVLIFFPLLFALGSFRVAPRTGHMDRVKRVYGYLRKHPDGAIRFRTLIPNT